MEEVTSSIQFIYRWADLGMSGTHWLGRLYIWLVGETRRKRPLMQHAISCTMIVALHGLPAWAMLRPNEQG